VLGQVISFPISYVLPAKGRSKLFFYTELSSNLVYLGLIWVGLRYEGLPGLGMAFFGLYVFHTVLVLMIVRRLTGFRWTKSNLNLYGVSFLATAVVFIATGGILPRFIGMLVGGVITLLTGIYAIVVVGRRLGFENFRVFGINSKKHDKPR
jgi:PST family polysaccharide transporter